MSTYLGVKFLDNVATSTLVFESSDEIRQYPGGYSDWVKKGKDLSSKEQNGNTKISTELAKENQLKYNNGQKKLGYKLQRELDLLPDFITNLEVEIASLDSQIEDINFYKKPYEETQPVLDEAGSLRSRLDTAVSRWAELENLAY